MKTMIKSKRQLNRIRAMLVTFLLVGVMIISTACKKQETDAEGASAFVKSFMDMMIKGEMDDFEKYSGYDEEEVEKLYDRVADSMYVTLGEAGVPEDVQTRFVEDILKKALAKSKYTVGKAEETGDNKFKVDIEIEPVTGLYDGIPEEFARESAAYMKEKLDKHEAIDLVESQNWVYNTVLDELEARLDSLEYGEKETVTVEVIKDGDHYKFNKGEEYAQEIGDKIWKLLVDIRSLEMW